MLSNVIIIVWLLFIQIFPLDDRFQLTKKTFLNELLFTYVLTFFNVRSEQQKRLATWQSQRKIFDIQIRMKKKN
jgi:hypothetical protein